MRRKAIECPTCGHRRVEKPPPVVHWAYQAQSGDHPACGKNRRRARMSRRAADVTCKSCLRSLHGAFGPLLVEPPLS